MNPKIVVLLCLVAILALSLSSKVAARELSETAREHIDAEETAATEKNGVDDAMYGGGYGGYPGGGYGGHGGYRGGGYGGHGGYGRGGYGHGGYGHGGYGGGRGCRYGRCCGYGRCRCCAYAGEVIEAKPEN